MATWWGVRERSPCVLCVFVAVWWSCLCQDLRLFFCGFDYEGTFGMKSYMQSALYPIFKFLLFIAFYTFLASCYR